MSAASSHPSQFGGSLLNGLVAFVAIGAALALATEGHGMVGVLFGLVGLYSFRRAVGTRHSHAKVPPATTAVSPLSSQPDLPSSTPIPRKKEAREKMPLALKREREVAERLQRDLAKRAEQDAQARAQGWSKYYPPSAHSRPSSSGGSGGGASGPVTSWQQAEASARDWMRRNGYSDAELTSGGADGGIDVHSRQAIAQVKHQRQPVGAAKIRELKGTSMSSAQGGGSALFFSSYGYSPQAIATASDLGVQLFQLDGGTWRRAN